MIYKYGEYCEGHWSATYSPFKKKQKEFCSIGQIMALRWTKNDHSAFWQLSGILKTQSTSRVMHTMARWCFHLSPNWQNSGPLVAENTPHVMYTLGRRVCRNYSILDHVGQTVAVILVEQRLQLMAPDHTDHSLLFIRVVCTGMVNFQRYYEFCARQSNFCPLVAENGRNWWFPTIIWNTQSLNPLYLYCIHWLGETSEIIWDFGHFGKIRPSGDRWMAVIYLEFLSLNLLRTWYLHRNCGTLEIDLFLDTLAKFQLSGVHRWPKMKPIMLTETCKAVILNSNRCKMLH